jgi:hypothetical protein
MILILRCPREDAKCYPYAARKRTVIRNGGLSLSLEQLSSALPIGAWYGLWRSAPGANAEPHKRACNACRPPGPFVYVLYSIRRPRIDAAVASRRGGRTRCRTLKNIRHEIILEPRRLRVEPLRPEQVAGIYYASPKLLKESGIDFRGPMDKRHHVPGRSRAVARPDWPPDVARCAGRRRRLATEPDLARRLRCDHRKSPLERRSQGSADCRDPCLPQTPAGCRRRL